MDVMPMIIMQMITDNFNTAPSLSWSLVSLYLTSHIDLYTHITELPLQFNAVCHACPPMAHPGYMTDMHPLWHISRPGL